jgi:hypothetical protein
VADSDEVPTPGPHDDTSDTGHNPVPVPPRGDDDAPDFMAGEDFGSHEDFFAELARTNRGDDEEAKAEPEDFGFDEIGRDDDDVKATDAGTGAGEARGARRRRGRPQGSGRRGGGRPPRRRAPSESPFSNPRVRLLLGVALAVVVVAIIVLFVRQYERSRLVDGYTSFVNQSSQIAQSSAAVGTNLIHTMENTSGQPANQLKANIASLDAQAAHQVAQAQALDAPSGAADAKRALVLALQYRKNGLDALSTNLDSIVHSSGSVANATVASAMQRFLASDVIVQDSYLAETAQALRNESIGVSVPSTSSVLFLPGANQAFVLPGGAARLVTSMQHVGSAATGQGAPRGLSLVSVVAEPGSLSLTPGNAATIPESSNLHWAVTVQNGGTFVENNIKVSASLSYGTTPVDVQINTIATINPGQSLVVSIPGPQASAVKLGTAGLLHVQVGTVPGEQNISNNAADYPITITFN